MEDTLASAGIRPRTFGWVALTAIAPIAWGSNYYVTREFLPEDSALWGAAIRALPAGLVLLAISRKLPHGSWWWKSAVLGILNIGAFFALVYVVAQLLPSGVAATTMASSAGVLMLFAWLMLGERPARWPMIGALMGFIGVAVMVFDAQGGIDIRGIISSLVAMLCSSAGFILTKRWSQGLPIVRVTAWQLVAGGAVLVPCALLVHGAPPQLGIQAAAGFGYVSLVATAAAYLAWFTGLRQLPATSVGLIGLLNPVTGVLLGTLLAAESLGLQSILGMALVLGGVLLGLANGSRRKPLPEPELPSRDAPAGQAVKGC
ncbi:DMT family transporter [Glutamicibacter sp. PAEs-4]|uniref:DMT family transporter n=1 Tax=Glutamicibacter sp. PAEs-4 TaxID=3444114 RepID=UPI003EB799C9